MFFFCNRFRAAEGVGPYKSIPPPSSTSFRASAHTGVGIRFSRRPASTGMDGLPRRCAPRNDVQAGNRAKAGDRKGRPYKEPGHVSPRVIPSEAEGSDRSECWAERISRLRFAPLEKIGRAHV